MSPDAFKTVYIKKRPINRMEWIGSEFFAIHGKPHRVDVNILEFPYDYTFRKYMIYQDSSNNFTGRPAMGGAEYVFAQDGRSEANTGGDKKTFKVDPETAGNILEGVTGLIGSLSQIKRNETKMQVRALCGRKPLRASKRVEWQKCVDRINAPKPEPYQYKPDPTPTYIAIGIGVLAIGGLIYMGVSMSKMKKATAAQPMMPAAPVVG